MKLKIFILPAFIILELILAIGFIKPNIDLISTKQSEITLQKNALSRVDSVAENIGKINASLDSRTKTVAFIERYFPKRSDEERVVDMLNYLAQQSGVVVTEVGIKENEKVATIAISEPVPVEGAVITAIPELSPELPESYEVVVSVFGSYQNIKDFFNRVYHADRLHSTKEFSIVARKDKLAESEEGTSDPQSTFLMGTIVADFLFIKEKQVVNALNVPLFHSPVFDFEAVEKVANFVTSPIPPLETENTGKNNPFE